MTSGVTTATSGSTLTSDFNTFLVMLTTQLQNQDPLNPMESSDFAVQLATFSGVEQQVQTNSLLQELVSQSAGLQIADLASWVGMEVRSTSPTYFSGAPVSLAFAAEEGADSAVLAVLDSDGTMLEQQSVDIGATQLDWSGSDDEGLEISAGLYHFRLYSYADGQLLGSSDAESYSLVTEARSTADGAVLVLKGGSEVESSAVTALRTPGES